MTNHYPGRAADMPREDQDRIAAEFAERAREILVAMCRAGPESQSQNISNWWGEWQAFAPYPVERSLSGELRELARKAASRNETNEARVMREAADALERGAVAEEGRP